MRQTPFVHGLLQHWSWLPAHFAPSGKHLPPASASVTPTVRVCGRRQVDAGVRHEVPDRLDVSVVDWTHGLGSSLVNQGITVKTTKSCSLAYGWGDQLALAPAK